MSISPYRIPSTIENLSKKTKRFSEPYPQMLFCFLFLGSISFCFEAAIEDQDKKVAKDAELVKACSEQSKTSYCLPECKNLAKAGQISFSCSCYDNLLIKNVPVRCIKR